MYSLIICSLNNPRTYYLFKYNHHLASICSPVEVNLNKFKDHDVLFSKNYR